MSEIENNETPNGTPESQDANGEFEAALDESFDELSEDEARLIELVGYLVQGIVAHPDDVEVEEFLDDIGSVYGVRVHGDDIGRVIGKDGRVANALRQVVKAAATKSGAHVTVEIMTDDTPHEPAANGA
jgi:predicted RNA-binding protein YlqC (UPF0109 family)